MFGVIVSIIGVAFAAWVFLDNAQKEQVKAKVALNRQPLLECLVCSVVLAILTPGLQSWIHDDYSGWESLAVIGIQVLIVACAIRAGHLIYPNGEWDKLELKQFEPRIERLLLTDHASTVVDVLSQSFPISLRLRNPDNPFPRSEYIDQYDAMLHRALWHKEFVRAAAVQSREYLALLLSRESQAAFWNIDQILSELMFGKEQMLRRELSLCTNYGEKPLGHFYRIPDECVVVHAIFDHVEVAHLIHAWKSIGDGTLRYLSVAKHSGQMDLEQLPFNEGESAESVRWNSDVGSSLWFFRVMATSAALQGITDHMWLPYLRHFVKGIVEIADVPDHDPWVEYPNRYCYWLKDCLECLEEVISMTREMGPDNPNYPTLQQGSNNTIITWSLQLISECLYTIFKSDNIPESVKEKAADSLCRKYKDWKKNDYPSFMPDFAVRHLCHSKKPEELKLIARYVERAFHDDIYEDDYEELRDKLLQQAS